jgi:ketosteroid isomerase-like protein
LSGSSTARDTVERFFALAAAQDARALGDLVADDVVSLDPITGPPTVGRDAHRAMFASMDELFRSVGFDVDVLDESQHQVVVRWTARAQLVDGRRSQFGGVDVFRTDVDQRISGHWAFWDPDDIEAHAITPEASVGDAAVRGGVRVRRAHAERASGGG